MAEQSMIEALVAQMNKELANAHAYLALAAWCDFRNYKGFARFFSKQAAEERGHAQLFLTHMLNRNHLPAIGAIPAPTDRFETLLDVAQAAAGLEQKNADAINALYERAAKQFDPSLKMLLDLIEEQLEEIDWSTEMAERVQNAGCDGALLELDNHIEQYMGAEGASAAK